MSVMVVFLHSNLPFLTSFGFEMSNISIILLYIFYVAKDYALEMNLSHTIAIFYQKILHIATNGAFREWLMF